MTMTQTITVPVVATLASGLPAGTLVMTLQGEVAVEALMPGDRIISRTMGTAVLRDVAARVADVAMVRILAGSLGHTRPGRDLSVGPDTMIHIRDWRAQALYGKPAALIPARRLVDGEFVALQDHALTTLYTLTFDRPQVVYADGLEICV